MEKSKVKKIIADIVKVISFTLVFFLLLYGLSSFVFTGTKVASLNKRMADAYAFTEDDDYTTDIVCLGSSDMYSGFVPITLWKDFGYTSVVSCCSHETLDEALMLLKNIQQNQNPKLVLLEIDTMYDGRNTGNVIEKGNENLDKFFESVDPDLFDGDVERVFSIFTFHNMWKLDTKSKRTANSHGYLLNNKSVNIVELKANDYMRETDDFDMPINKNINALEEFTQYCKDQGLDIAFIEMPSKSSWNYARHNAMQEIADNLGVKFVDANLLYDEIGINQENCYRDQGNHLTYDAAVKVTDYLGKYFLQTNFSYLVDHRDDPKYATRWNEDMIAFEEAVTEKIEKHDSSKAKSDSNVTSTASEDEA